MFKSQAYSTIGETLKSPHFMEKIRITQPVVRQPRVEKQVETTKQLVQRLLK